MRRTTRWTLSAVLAASALTMAAPAAAHIFKFGPPLAKRSLEGRAAGQRLVIWHDRQMISMTCGLPAPRVALFSFSVPAARDRAAVRSCRFHSAQLRWTRRELRQTEAAIRARDRPTTPGTAAGGWLSGQATWYGPNFYGHPPSCGGNGVLTKGSMWAASMTLGCGTPVTICTSVCVRTTVEDTGDFSVAFDLAPGLAHALGCYCTQTVRYRVG